MSIYDAVVWFISYASVLWTETLLRICAAWHPMWIKMWTLPLLWTDTPRCFWLLRCNWWRLAWLSMMPVLSIMFTLHHQADEALYKEACVTFCSLHRASKLLPVSHVLLCRCNWKTQYLYEFSEFVLPLRHLLFFHTDGIFVILINVSIFRMSRNRVEGEEFIHIGAVCRRLSPSNVVGFWGNTLVNLSQLYLLESTEVVNGKKTKTKNKTIISCLL